MASTIAKTFTPDTVSSFEINPGTLLQFLETRPERGPRLKCLEGSVTLVSPGMPHEAAAERLGMLVLAVCLEMKIKLKALASTTWTLPFGAGDTAYEADKAYYIQSHGTEKSQHRPDLAVEIVVSHSEKKALLAGAFLKIPEMWVLDLSRHKLTFYHLAVGGKSKGKYRPQPRSRAFPMLTSAEVLERLDDPEGDDIAFHENCRAWAKRLTVPPGQNKNGGA
jgi:Uma2 family endonuclease